MINSLTVSNYKNLPELELPVLKRVNLISGKNNSGKSTLLEAIGIFTVDSLIFSVLEDRGELKVRHSRDSNTAELNISSLKSLFTSRNVEKHSPITISDANAEMSMRFVNYVFRESEVDGELVKRKVEVSEQDDISEEILAGFEIARTPSGKAQQKYIIPLDRTLSKFAFRDERLHNEYKKLVCIDSRSDDSTFLAELWDEIALTDLELPVIKALQIVEPDIENLTFVESKNSRGRVPVVKMKGSYERLPLKSLGDGINNMLRIILSLVTCKNGCWLADEIDNGLHHTVQRQLWEVIIEISEKFNIQIFATTHSTDCIISFSKALLSSSYPDAGQYLRMEHDSESAHCVSYNADELRIVATQQLEIR